MSGLSTLDGSEDVMELEKYKYFYLAYQHWSHQNHHECHSRRNPRQRSIRQTSHLQRQLSYQHPRSRSQDPQPWKRMDQQRRIQNLLEKSCWHVQQKLLPFLERRLSRSQSRCPSCRMIMFLRGHKNHISSSHFRLKTREIWFRMLSLHLQGLLYLGLNQSLTALQGIYIFEQAFYLLYTNLFVELWIFVLSFSGLVIEVNGSFILLLALVSFKHLLQKVCSLCKLLKHFLSPLHLLPILPILFTYPLLKC